MGKRWVRIVISLLLGGVLQESIRLATGRDVKGLVLVGALLLYILISIFFYFHQTMKLQKEVDKQLTKNDELIDDFS